MIRSIFFIVSLMAAGTSLAGCTSQECPVDVDTVPIQIVRGGGEPDQVTTLTAADLNYSSGPGQIFSFFARDVTEHLAAKLAQEKICLSSAESRERSLIQFVRWSGWLHETPVPQLAPRPLGVCRISSPWIDIVIARKPVPMVRGVVRYSLRQVWIDQALLAGGYNVPPGMTKSISHEEFERYAFEYASSEIYHKPTSKPIEERVPPDLLWLFDRSWDKDIPLVGSFSGWAGSSGITAMDKGTKGYTRIVIALIDQCFASDGADIHYDNVLGVADLVPLEQYKITTPIIEPPQR